MSTDNPHTRQRLLPMVRSVTRLVGRALTTCAVVALLFAGHQYWGTDLRAARAQQDLHRQLAVTFAGSHPPAAARPDPLAPSSSIEIDTPTRRSEPAAALSLLRIARLDLDLVVLDGADRASLQRGPGLLTGTPLPGRTGNSVIAGHRTTWGAPFAHLERLRPGDRIEVTTSEGRSDYLVTTPSPVPISAPEAGHRIIRADDLRVARQVPGQSRLTLLTCHPRFSASRRLVVVADRVGPAVKPSTSSGSLAATNVGSPSLDVLAFNDPDPAGWPQTVVPGTLALLCWILAGRLAKGPDGRSRRRRVLRIAGWRTTGAALAAVPLFVTFDRVAPLLPIGG